MGVISLLIIMGHLLPTFPLMADKTKLLWTCLCFLFCNLMPCKWIQTSILTQAELKQHGLWIKARVSKLHLCMAGREKPREHVLYKRDELMSSSLARSPREKY